MCETYLPSNGMYKRLIKGQCDWSTEHKGRMVQDEIGEVAKDLPVYSLVSQVRGFCFYSKTLSNIYVYERRNRCIRFSFEKDD